MVDRDSCLSATLCYSRRALQGEIYTERQDALASVSTAEATWKQEARTIVAEAERAAKAAAAERSLREAAERGLQEAEWRMETKVCLGIFISFVPKDYSLGF